MKHVDRDRVGLHASERECEVDNIVVAFSHTDNAPGADLQASRSGVSDRGQPVLERVSRADDGVIRLTGVQVVIDAIDPCLLEGPGLAFAQQAE